MIKMAKTYIDVAKKEGLTGFRAGFYIEYMTLRWQDTEKQKCIDGYAEEWARRFKDGREYVASDQEGRKLIKDLYMKHWMNY